MYYGLFFFLALHFMHLFLVGCTWGKKGLCFGDTRIHYFWFACWNFISAFVCIINSFGLAESGAKNTTLMILFLFLWIRRYYYYYWWAFVFWSINTVWLVLFCLFHFNVCVLYIYII